MALPSGVAPTMADPPPPSGLVETRLRAVIEVARLLRVPVTLSELTALLPAGAGWTRSDVTSWIARNHQDGRVVGERVYPDRTLDEREFEERARRGYTLLEEARWAIERPLLPAVRVARCIGVSGSAAYGFAGREDDLDFMVVARHGGTWLFLVLAFLSARKARQNGGLHGASPWCFNYVVDEGAAREEFGRAQGFPFAREALTVRAIVGEAYYRQLLRESTWMGQELPTLYGERTAGPDDDPPPSSIGWLARVANMAIFPLLAAYLQLVGIQRNHRLRRRAPDRLYTTSTSLRRFALRSARYEELRRLGQPASAVGPGSAVG